MRAWLAAGRPNGLEYQARISEPLFDRINLHVQVPAASLADFTLPPPAEGSAEGGCRVAAARARQTQRYAPINATANGRTIRTNAEADGELPEQIAAPDAEGRRLLTEAAERFKLLARGWHRVLCVARTLPDL